MGLPQPAGGQKGTPQRVLCRQKWRCNRREVFSSSQVYKSLCKIASLDDIRKHGHVLAPGRYVGPPPREDDGEPFKDKMKRLVAQLREQQAEGAHLDAAIADNLKTLGFWGDEA